MLPKISIVTPSYNQGKFIGETILSVIEQDYPNLQYIIIDGGSSDNSLEIIKQYEDKLFYWISEPDNGQTHAINKGFSHATGQIFMWLNSDDILLKGSLYAIGKAYNNSIDKTRFIGLGRRVYIDNKSLVLKHLSYSFWMGDSQAIAYGVSRGPHQEATCWTKEIWERFGPLNQNLNYAFDLEFFIKIFSMRNNLIIIPQFIGAWRQWESNKCTEYNAEMMKELIKVKKERKNQASIFSVKYFKKVTRKLTKISQTRWSYVSGLPKIGQHIFSNDKVKQTTIPILWKTFLSKTI